MLKEYKTDPLSVFNFGPEVPIVKLKGVLAETNRDAAYAYTNWINPLRAMYRRSRAFPKMIADDDQVAYWARRRDYVGGYDITLSDVTAKVAKGINALKMSITAGSYQVVGIRHDHGSGSEKDYSKNDFITWWWYGANTGETWYCYFRTTLTDRYNVSFVDNFTGWQRFQKRKAEFGSVGSPSWATIRYEEFSTLPTQTYNAWLDRFVAGVGFYLDAPGSRYDGIYNVKRMVIDETHRLHNYFPYEIELWRVDNYY